jgi:acyl-CoA dehydrogenase
VRRAFADSYARLIAMKLFADRAIDYFRSASLEDRRYLLFNPLTKMKVTTEGERVIDELWDVMAAKGFERDMYFEMAARDIRGLPKLEGTVHVNMALVLKFMAGYLFNADGELAPPGRTLAPGDDDFLFRQGPARGLSKIRFSPWREAFAPFSEVPNAARFVELAESFERLLVDAAPDEDQQRDLDYLLTLGELFTLIPYGQLICEQASFVGLPHDTLDQVFDVMVRDFSRYAVELHGKTSATRAQQDWARAALAKPVVDAERFDSVFGKVRGLAGVYEMRA